VLTRDYNRLAYIISGFDSQLTCLYCRSEEARSAALDDTATGLYWRHRHVTLDYVADMNVASTAAGITSLQCLSVCFSLSLSLSVCVCVSLCMCSCLASVMFLTQCHIRWLPVIRTLKHISLGAHSFWIWTFVCHSACDPVCRITADWSVDFIETRCYDTSRKNSSTFGGDPVPETLPITFPCPSPLWNRRLKLDLLAFLIQSLADFHATRRNDCRRQGSEPTFWEWSGSIRDTHTNPD